MFIRFTAEIAMHLIADAVPNPARSFMGYVGEASYCNERLTIRKTGAQKTLK